MTRKSLLIGSVIVAAWVLTMGFLAKDYLVEDRRSTADSTGNFFESVTLVSRWEPVEEYMLLIHTDPNSNSRTIVGASSTRIEKIDTGTTRTVLRADFHLEGKLSPILPKATILASAHLDENVNLTNFHGRASLAGFQLAATGEILHNTLYLKTSNNSNINLRKTKLSQPPNMIEVIRPTLNQRMEIKPGAKMSTDVLDPLSGQKRGTLTVEIGDKEVLHLNGSDVEAYRVISSVGDIETVMWIDEEGKTIRRNLVANMVMERTDRETALQYAPSIDSNTAIPELDLSEFARLPIEDEPTPGASGSTQLNLLQSFLR